MLLYFNKFVAIGTNFGYTFSLIKVSCAPPKEYLKVRGNSMKFNPTWYENENFWQELEPLLFTDRIHADAVSEVGKVIDLLKLKEGSRVLDHCCGLGRHALQFARRGFSVTGVDITRAYLKKASRQAEKEGLQIDFVAEDVRTFRCPDTFDAAVSMYTSFGYFSDPDDDRLVAANVYDSLKPGGLFLIELKGKEIIARIFQEKDWHEVAGFTLLEERRISRNWSWLDHRWIAIKDNRRIEHTLSFRLYSAVELSNLLRECGFAEVDVYGDFSGVAYDHRARRLIVVGRKK